MKPIEQLRQALARAEEDLEKALSVYDRGGPIVEYDSDYFEGQVLAYQYAVHVLEGADNAT